MKFGCEPIMREPEEVREIKFGCEPIMREPVEPVSRPGTRYVAPPANAGTVKAMVLFRGRLLVAFAYGVYALNDDGSWDEIVRMPR